MKTCLTLCSSCLLLLLLTSTPAHATSVTLTVGTPGDSLLFTPTGPSPKIGTLINFDNTTTFLPFSVAGSFSTGGVTISSPDSLMVLPYSTQSDPNELYDLSSDGSANITISLLGGVNGIGVGIADSDPVTIFLQALGVGLTPLGSPFAVTIPENTVNAGNGYFVLSDLTPEIYGLSITQPIGNAALYSGLAIDDVQVTPEPGTIGLALTGFALMAARRKRLAQRRPDADTRR